MFVWRHLDYFETNLYLEYLIDEVIAPTIAEAHKKYLSSTTEIALDAAHSVAFHRGLGNMFYSSGLTTTPHLVAEEVEAYAAAAYAKSNIALVSSGVESAELSKWAGEFFKGIEASAPASLPALDDSAAKYYGGETRIPHGNGSTVVIAFPGSTLANGSQYKPEIDALAFLLGGQSSVKWSPGTSVLAKAVAPYPGVSVKTESLKYSDSGLLTVTVSGPSKSVSKAVKDVAAAIKSVAGGSPAAEDIKKALAQAKFKAYDAETADVPALDLVGLSAIRGKLQTSEESLKGVAAVSESALKTVSLL